MEIKSFKDGRGIVCLEIIQSPLRMVVEEEEFQDAFEKWRARVAQDEAMEICKVVLAGATIMDKPGILFGKYKVERINDVKPDCNSIGKRHEPKEGWVGNGHECVVCGRVYEEG